MEKIAKDFFTSHDANNLTTMHKEQYAKANIKQKCLFCPVGPTEWERGTLSRKHSFYKYYPELVSKPATEFVQDINLRFALFFFCLKTEF